MNSTLRISVKKTLKGFIQVIPVLLGVLLLVSLAVTAIPKEYYTTVFSGNNATDSVAGAVLGSISAGNPMTSYIIGGELLRKGVSLVAVTAFILSWVTVGVVQLPAEMLMLGKRFGIVRNIISFFMAVCIAVLTVITLHGLGYA